MLNGPKARRVREGKLYSYQEDIRKNVLEGGLEGGPEGKLHILVAPTGSGKTLAALLPFLEGFEEKIRHSMYHVLPTRSLASRFFRDYIEGYFGYSYEGGSSQRIGELKIGLEYGGIAGTRRFMSTEIVVSTRDVFVYSLVGSSITKGYPDVPIGFIAGSYVVLDEVQMLQDEFSYGPRILKKVVETLLRIGSTVLIITATFPEKYLKLLLEYEPKLYVVGSENPYSIEARIYPEDVEKIASNRASGERYKISSIISSDPLEDIVRKAEVFISSGKTLVVLNTVNEAIEVYKRLKKRLDKVLLLHSRFAERDRRKKENKIEEYDVIVATQVVEAGLDLPDISYVVTYLAPIDALIQRLGRAGRSGNNAEAAIIIPEELYSLAPYFYLGEALGVIKAIATERIDELAKAMSDAGIAAKLVSEMFEMIEDPFENASILKADKKSKLYGYRDVIFNLYRSYRALETLSINEFSDDIRARPGDYIEVAVKIDEEYDFLRLPRAIVKANKVKTKRFLARNTLKERKLEKKVDASRIYDNLGIPIVEKYNRELGLVLD